MLAEITSDSSSELILMWTSAEAARNLQITGTVSAAFSNHGSAAMTTKELSVESANWCNAATLAERITELRGYDGTDSVSSDNELAELRLQHWHSQAPFSKGSFFAQRLAADGLSEAEFRFYLGEPAEALQGRLGYEPAWLKQIRQAFFASDGSPLPYPQASDKLQHAGFLTLVEPLLRDALHRVQTAVEELAKLRPELFPDAPALAALLFANLPWRLLGMLNPTLVLELHVARLEGRLDGATAEERFHQFVEKLRNSESALALLEEYPVLARQLVTHINNWVGFSLEFLQQLADDWETLCERFAAGRDPGEIVEISANAGDSHRNGRSVQIVKFSSGLRLVYKPRSLKVDEHFQALLSWLNERGSHPAFRVMKIVDRGGHGWAEFIAPETCTSEDQLRRFYERQGAYLALLYALEATDFHCENLIAAGEHPLLLDLEALFHPRVNGIDLQGAEHVASDAIVYSVLRVGLLPQRLWQDEDSAGIDLSGLAALPGQLTPRPVPLWEGSGTDEMRMVRKRVEMSGEDNRPTLNGDDVNVLEYEDAIIAGFTAVYRTLLLHRDELVAGPLQQFADDEVRAIMRATNLYSLLLRESFHPDVLRSGLDRDRLFDHLWIMVEHCPHLARIIAAEHGDLQRGDVPIFTTKPSSRDVWSSSREPLVDFFDEPGIVPVQRRIRQLSDADLSQQIWFIRASLSTLSRAETGSRPPSSYPAEASMPAGREQFLTAACRLADRLEKCALHGQQDISWIGLTMTGRQDWVLLPLGLDLYDGLPGMALYLAYLGEIVAESRYTALSVAVMDTVRRTAQRVPAEALGMGAYDGWAGMIYLLTHMGTLWNRSDLLTEADALVERILPSIEKDERFDIISGAAGCIPSLLGLYRLMPSDRTLDAAIRCGRHLVEKAQEMPHGVGWVVKGMGSNPLTGFSHGAAGVAWSLLELSALTGEEIFRTTALRALQYERSLFSATEGNWPDLRDLRPHSSAATDEGNRFVMAWCHGAPGVGLGRLLCLQHAHNDEIHSEIGAALETTLARGFGANHSICHGDLGNLELLLTAHLTLREPRYKAELNRMAAIILENAEQNGWRCGNPAGVEAPGLMTGLAGIGYQLLRLAEPARVPSVLALAPPPSRCMALAPRDIAFSDSTTVNLLAI